MPADPCPGCNDFQRGLDRAAVHGKGAAIAVDPMPGKLRLLSWNIAHGHDLARLASALQELRPDIACLQEVDWGNRRTGGRDVLEELAAACGMAGWYGVEFVEIDSPRRSAAWQGGGVTGNAILCRGKPRSVRRVELPACFDWEGEGDHPRLTLWNRWRVRGEPRLGRRFALVADFDTEGGPMSVASVHLEDKLGGIAGRWAQFDALRAALASDASPGTAIAIAGDLNTYDSYLGRLYTGSWGEDSLGMPAYVGEPTWWRDRLLPGSGFVDPFPPTTPTFRLGPLGLARLDWILLRNMIATRTGHGPYASSDHRPIWLDAELG